MNIIIFNRTIGGHHLEYIHHIYMAAISHRNDTFYFVLPKHYDSVKDNWDWPYSPNIHIELFGKEDDKYVSESIWQILHNSWTNSKLVRYYVKKYRADVVYCNSIIGLVPFAPLFLSRKVRLMGVIYRIYLYDSQEKSRVSLLSDKIKYVIMSKAKVFQTIFILNDHAGAGRLNEIYHTQKFVSLPDPYVPIPTEQLTDFRKEYGIPADKKLLVQFGTLCKNKSTVEILEAVKLLGKEEKKLFAFAFAGKVYDEIKERFYELVKELQVEVQIIVIDQYCTYETFASMCTACDAILTPYRRTAQSSGLIGYASQFHKPVIAPNRGLLGSLVESFGLGELIKDNTPKCLVEAFRKVARGEVIIPDSSYCEMNSVEEFQRVCFENLINETNN